MASVHDVAAYIVGGWGPLNPMHLHRLTYYVKAWSAVWGPTPIFRARIEAWASGPVCPELWRYHRGVFTLATWPKGRAANLTLDQRAMVISVMEHCNAFAAIQLNQLAQLEQPWRDARRGLWPGARSSREITPEAMRAYYGSIGAQSTTTATTATVTSAITATATP